MGEPFCKLVATRFRGLCRDGGTLDAELLHSAAKGVRVKIQNPGCAVGAFNNAASIPQDLQDMRTFNVLKGVWRTRRDLGCAGLMLGCVSFIATLRGDRFENCFPGISTS